MTRETVISAITPFMKKHLAAGAKAFVFGSLLRKEKFYDIDIGILGNVDRGKLARLREDFEESTFPYKVDVVDFTRVNEEFRKKVFEKEIVWLNI